MAFSFDSTCSSLLSSFLMDKRKSSLSDQNASIKFAILPGYGFNVVAENPHSRYKVMICLTSMCSGLSSFAISLATCALIPSVIRTRSGMIETTLSVLSTNMELDLLFDFLTEPFAPPTFILNKNYD